MPCTRIQSMEPLEGLPAGVVFTSSFVGGRVSGTRLICHKLGKCSLPVLACSGRELRYLVANAVSSPHHLHE